MTTFVTREQWGARAARPGGNKFTTILGTAVHWEAAAPPANHADCPDAVRAVQAYHMDHNGWNDIAYNLVACNHDCLFEGRMGGTAANGTNYGNDHFPAVCWLGGPGHTPEDGALRALSTAHSRLGGLGKPIHPHNYFYPTACPGPYLTTWVQNGAHAPQAPPAEPLHWKVIGGEGTEYGPYSTADAIDRMGVMMHNIRDGHVDDPPTAPDVIAQAVFHPAGYP